MAPQSFLRLLFISLCLAVATVSARHSPHILNKQQPENENGVSRTHTTNKMVVKTPRGGSALKRICGKTDHPALCMATVAPFLRGKATVDTAFVASVRAASNFGQRAIGEMQSMAQKASPGLRSTYKDCMGFYQTALDSFRKTLDAQHSHDLGTMRTQLSSAITWLETCEDEFSESGDASPLAGIADKLQSITSDSLAMVDQM